jgi:hypothetical protein
MNADRILRAAAGCYSEKMRIHIGDLSPVVRAGFILGYHRG